MRISKLLVAWLAVWGSVSTLAGCAATRPTLPPTQPAFFTSPADDFDAAWLKSVGVDPQRVLCNRENRYGNTVKSDSAEGSKEMMEALSPYLKPLDGAEREKAQDLVRHALMWRMVRGIL